MCNLVTLVLRSTEFHDTIIVPHSYLLCDGLYNFTVPEKSLTPFELVFNHSHFGEHNLLHLKVIIQLALLKRRAQPVCFGEPNLLP